MKKTLLTLFGAFVISASALAATVNVASDGTVWLDKPQPVVSKVEVAFDEGVLDLGDSWKQAFAQKGTVVPVEAHFESRRVGLFHVERTRVVDVGVVYDGTHVSIVRGVAGETMSFFTPYVLFWLVSIVLMSVGVWKVQKGEGQGPVAALAFVAACIATFGSFGAVVTIFLASLSILPALFASVVAVVAVATNNKKEVVFWTVIVYHVFMAASMAAFLFA